METDSVLDDLRRAARVSAACETGVSVPAGSAFVVPWRADAAVRDWLADRAAADPSAVRYVAATSDPEGLVADQHYVFPAAWVDPSA